MNFFKLFKKDYLYLPQEGDTIVVIKPFFYEDITDRVYDEYPELYQQHSAFSLYKGRIVLEYKIGQEYTVEKVLGIDKISMKDLKKYQLKGTYASPTHKLILTPSEYQPNRIDVTNSINYLTLYGKYVMEKTTMRDNRLKEIGI